MPDIDAQRATSLADIRGRLERSDLIPSQQPLLERTGKRFEALEGVGIDSASDLLDRLKDKRAVVALADESGVDADYLNLLRRAVSGFFPKPRRWTEFETLAPELVAALKRIGITNTRQLYEAARDDATGLAARTECSDEELSQLRSLADLSRIQWVSPAYASALAAAGYRSVAEVAGADPEVLSSDIEGANVDARFYRGKVGLRDIRRLVEAAGYVR